MDRNLGALADRRFRWFFLAQLVNRLGGMMTPVTLTFAVLSVSNKASSLSFTLSAQVAAVTLCVVLGGVAGDRLARGLVVQVCYVATAALEAALAVLLLTGHATVPLLVLFSALIGAVTGLAMPAFQGVIPQLVDRARLQQANALLSFIKNGTSLLGPVLGTLLVVAFGPQVALFIDAASFLAASALLLRAGLPPADRDAPRASLARELRAGWGEFTSRTWLWVIVLAFCALNMIVSGADMLLGPVVAKSTPALGIRGWGLVLGAVAVGAVATSAALTRVRLGRPLLAGMLGVFLMTGLIVLLGWRPATVPLMAAALVGGAGSEVFSTGWQTALMEHVPQQVLSRVSSYDMLGSWVAIPAGLLVYGWLAGQFRPGPLLAGSAVAYAAICLATLAVPQVRALGRADRQPAPEPVPAPAPAPAGQP